MKVGDTILYLGDCSPDGFEKLPDEIGKVVSFDTIDPRLINIQLNDGKIINGVHPNWIKPFYSKMYILIKDWVDVGHAVNTAAHASLMCYLEHKDDPDMKEWLENSFRKVSCEVTEEEFERAKDFRGCTVVTENAFDNKEVALAFLPRKEWPEFFKYLRLYGKINEERQIKCPSCDEFLGFEGQILA